MRTKLALLAAIILGFLAAIGVRHYVEQQRTRFDEMATRVAIAVAREGLNPGDILREHMLKPLQVEVGAITDNHILYDQRKSWLGQKLTKKVRAEHAIMKDDFLAPEVQSEAHRKIDTGMRAVTIGTDQIAGVAGLIVPGSRVDVLGSFRVQARNTEGGGSVVLKVIARNVEVLAIDNRTELSAPLRGGRGQYDRGYSSITLHVTPLEASLLTFAQNTAKISFTLRHAEDDQGKGEDRDITMSEFDALVAEAARRRAQMNLTPKVAPTPAVP